jgi:ribonuclease D
VALDTETFDPNLGPDDAVADGDALDVRVARVRLIQVKTEDGTLALVDAKALDPAPLLEVLRDKTLIMHNAAFDLAVLRTNFGYVHDGPVIDTMTTAQVLYAGQYSVSARLEELAEKLLEVDIDKTQQRTKWGFELSGPQLEYAAADVEHLHELDEVLRARQEE